MVEQYAAVQNVKIFPASILDPTLGGRVLDHALAAVAAAQVSAVGTAVTSTTDPAGAYALPGLAFGTYTLRVHQDGVADVDLPVTYEEEHQFHDLVLPAP